MESRVLLIGLLTLVVIALALGTRRWQRPIHRPLSVLGRGFQPGYVVFTSTECENCKAALAAVKRTGEPLREVTWELESGLLEDLGVESVPLVVRVGEDGEATDQVVGVPSKAWLRRTAR